MTMRIYHLFIFGMLLAGFGCKEEKLEPLTKGGKAPGMVSNVNVDNQPGKVVLTYDIPSDPELLYIKAVYEIRDGKKMESISTFYNNFVTLEGFGNTDEREVKLYAVSRSEVSSEPVTVKVKPLTPPVMSTLASLDFSEDFGGITARFSNEDSASIAIGVLTRDENGDPVQSDMYYTSQTEGEFSVRGFDDTERWFGLFVRDRWQNYSDTVWKLLTPLFEQQLDKANFRSMKLATDANMFGSGPLTNLWNDKVQGGSSSNSTWTRTANGSGVPHWVTFDLGVTAKLSRFVEIPRGAFDELNLLYAAGDPRLFELWGATDYNPDGSFDGWTKLSEFEVVKVSGLPTGVNSNDDILRAQEGHQFKIPIDAPPVRYIRIKMLETFGNSDYFWMAELTFFGQIQ
ncbi:DUF5000 domain-containing lipoprotein [Chitinophaga sp. XS-30]|uniref:DUF5000 domain-containing lipoprotein n=1 Tax=Chitinophaga sp. XS-30 TaxID=2604421 RepID=UPI0011DDD2C0|nr:DUF5000 domain-containing lipoprotein [Chitinophaga sp. XS-30]QEH42044.1 DUF4959 domain-containing protein [Chitinophaga sp. XS-30]